MTLLYAASTGLGFLVGVLLARLLGASGYGVYALAMTGATLIGMMTEFGLPVLALREVGAARATGAWGRVRGLIAWSDRTILSLSALLVGGTAAWLTLRPPDSAAIGPATVLWAAALVPFVAIGKLRAFVLLALDRVFASQFPVMVLRPLLFLAGCGAIWFMTGNLDPGSALAAQTIGAAVVMVLSITLYQRSRPAELIAATPQTDVGTWLSASLPMGMTEGLRLLQGQLGLLLVGLLAGTAQAGLFRVADAVTQITALFAAVVGTIASPMFGRLWSSGNRDEVQRLSALSAWAMVGGAIVLGLPIVLLGEWLFPWIFGPGFAGSARVFLVLWGGTVVASLGGLAFALANMTGRHVLATQSFALIAGVNALSALALVPRLGAVGGAIATIVGSIVGVAYCALRLHREEGLNPTIFSRSSAILLRQGRDRISHALRGTDN